MSWDVTTPAGSEAVSQGDDRIREFKVDVQAGLRANDATLGNAGAFPGGDVANPRFHYRGLKGTTAQRPAAGNYGLYFNTTTRTLQRDNGSVWEDINIGAAVTTTDNAIARFDGTLGFIKNSGVTIDASNNINTPGNIIGGNITSSNIISAPRYDMSGGSGTPGFLAKSPNTATVRSSASGALRPVVVSADPTTNGLMICRGTINGATGALSPGEGFSGTSRTGTGRYSLTFLNPFVDTPSAVVTLLTTTISRIAVVSSISTTSFTVNIDGPTFPADESFCFIVIGQRGS